MDQHDVFIQFIDSIVGGVEVQEDIDSFDPTGTIFYQGDIQLMFNLHAFSLLSSLPVELTGDVVEVIGKAVRTAFESDEYDLVCIAAPGIVAAHNDATGEYFSGVHVIGFAGKSTSGSIFSAIVALDSSGNRRLIEVPDSSPVITEQFEAFFKGFFDND